jgi:hypothetical protein
MGTASAAPGEPRASNVTEARAYTRAVLPAPPPPVPDAPPRGEQPGGPTTDSSTRWWTPGRTAVGLAGAAVAGCAYVALVDPNESSWYPQCPFKAMTGWDCPGCGITRAVRAVVTGNPQRALDHNALLVLAVVVGLVWYGVNWLRTRRGRPPLALRRSAWWTGALVALVALFWVTRNIPWGPLGWLDSAASGV